MNNITLNKYLNISELGLIDIISLNNKTVTVVLTEYSLYVKTRKGFFCHSEAMKHGEIKECPKYQIGEIERDSIKFKYPDATIRHQIEKKVDSGILVETQFRITPSFSWIRLKHLMNPVLKTISKQPFAVIKEKNSITLNVFYGKEQISVTLLKNKSNDKLVRKFVSQSNLYDQLAYMALLVKENKAVK